METRHSIKILCKINNSKKKKKELKTTKHLLLPYQIWFIPMYYK